MIRVHHLTKTYGKTLAVDNIDLHVPEGKVFGFIGPNGAGKTTVMQILSCLLAPTSGGVTVGGYDVLRHPRKVKQLLGYMPDFFGVYDNLKTVEYLQFYASAHDIPKSKHDLLIDDLLQLVNLSNKKEAYVDTLSRGMKQRLGLARCLIHDPQVLILDEPASGLDPRARLEMREILKELKRMRKTILISSHILPELTDMCDDIAVIEKGKLIAQGNVQEIASEAKGMQTLRITLLDEAATAKKAYHVLKNHPQVQQVLSVEDKETELKVRFQGREKEQAHLLKTLIDSGVQVVGFSAEQEDLEEVFLSITEGVGY